MKRKIIYFLIWKQKLERSFWNLLLPFMNWNSYNKRRKKKKKMKIKIYIKHINKNSSLQISANSTLWKRWLFLGGRYNKPNILQWADLCVSSLLKNLLERHFFFLSLSSLSNLKNAYERKDQEKFDSRIFSNVKACFESGVLQK